MVGGSGCGGCADVAAVPVLEQRSTDEKGSGLAHCRFCEVKGVQWENAPRSWADAGRGLPSHIGL